MSKGVFIRDDKLVLHKKEHTDWIEIKYSGAFVLRVIDLESAYQFIYNRFDYKDFISHNDFKWQ